MPEYRDDDFQQDGLDLLPREIVKPKKPRLYKVIILNDDWTPVEFVAGILESHFNKSREEAWTLTMEVHTKGSGIAGIYTYEVAEQKIIDVHAESRRAQHPLKLELEPE